MDWQKTEPVITWNFFKLCGPPSIFVSNYMEMIPSAWTTNILWAKYNNPQTSCHSIEPSTSTHKHKKIDCHIISNIVFKLIRSHHSSYLDGSFLFVARPIDHFPGPHDNQRLSSNEYVTPIWVYCSDVHFFYYRPQTIKDIIG